MFLAHALSAGRDELICDLAETYRIYDMKQLPLKTVAAFAYGLRNDSRIKMKLRGDRYTMSELMLAMIYDRTAVLQWYFTKRKGEPPESLAAKLLDIDDNDVSDVVSFEDGGEYEALRASLLKGDDSNGN